MLILRQGTIQQFLQILLLQRFQHIDLAATQEWGDDLKTRILRRSTHQRHNAFFHSAQQAILLRFGKSVYLVYKQDRTALIHLRSKDPAIHHGSSFGLVDHVAHLLHATRHGTQRIKRPLQLVGDDTRQRRLAYARRAPQDETRQIATLDHLSQYGPFAYQVLLAYVFVQRLRTQAFC